MYKICNRCNARKELSEFHKNKLTKDGRLGVCRECQNAWTRQRRIKENQDRARKREIAIRNGTIVELGTIGSRVMPRVAGNKMLKWNKNEGYELEFIELHPIDYDKIMSQITYDEREMLYRDGAGNLLKTRSSVVDLLKRF